MKTIFYGMSFFLIFALLTVSCNKTEKQDPEKQSAEQQSTREGTEEKTDTREPQRTLTIELEKEKESQEEGMAVEGGTDPKAEVLPVSFQEQLLPMRSGPKIFPEDFEIGPLQNRYSDNRDRAGVYKKAARFFEILKDKEIAEKLVHPEWEAHIQRFLWYYIRENNVPESVRVGSVTINEDLARANIRLFKDKGKASGEIFLQFEEDEWYITDIQADFSKLEKEYTREERFEPEMYRWLQVR